MNRWQPVSPLVAKRMPPAERRLMLAEQQAEFHVAEFERHLEMEADIEAALGESVAHPDTATQAAWAVDALVTLGEFEKAREIAAHAPEGYADTVEAHDAACLRDDEERCECSHPEIAKTEGGSVGLAVNFGSEPMPKYLVERPVIYNPYFDRIDSVYLCHLCGHRNALPEPPDAITAEQQDLVDQAHAAA